MLNETNTSVEPEQTDTFEITPNWAPDAPRGGRAVLTRISKESATVPLFLAQTFVQSLRDVGYNTTTSALEEHVDNAIEAGASEIRVFFHQTGGKGSFETDIMVYDNGRGMPPNVLKVATSFGGSLSYGNRSGIGRFGMGMKTAALSMSPVMELYSWQEPKAVYNEMKPAAVRKRIDRLRRRLTIYADRTSSPGRSRPSTMRMPRRPRSVRTSPR